MLMSSLLNVEGPHLSCLSKVWFLKKQYFKNKCAEAQVSGPITCLRKKSRYNSVKPTVS